MSRQPVRVLGHDLDGVGTICLEDPHRSRGAYTVAVQKDHDFPHGLLFGPGRENAGRANRSDAVDLAQPIRCGLDDFEHFLAKGANELLGVDRSHTPDHAGRQIFFDAIGRSRRRCAQEPRLELLAVGAVVDPFAGGRDPLAGGNGGGMANHGHDVTMPARPGAQNAKAVLGVVVGYSLDEARQHLAVGWFRLDLHQPRYSVRACCISKHCTGQNPVDSAGLNIVPRSTRSGPLINCTTKLLRRQPVLLCRTTNCDQRPFASRPDEMAIARRMARSVC
jgi:hypothetical protein